MKIYVERRHAWNERVFMEAVAKGAQACGYRLVRVPHHASVAIAWHSTSEVIAGRPIIWAEQGWLPRWRYQLAPGGINACSADAHPELEPPTDEDRRLAKALIDAAFEPPPHPNFLYASTRCERARATPPKFLLVPLQDEQDTNMYNAPAQVRSTLGLIRYVSKLDPPWRVVFKRHPARRAAQAHAEVKPLRRGDQVRSGPMHGFLSKRDCVGVLTINSNTAHDALLWDKPVACLGRGIWPESGPFFYGAPNNWLQWAQMDDETRDARVSYLAWLARVQWEPEPFDTERLCKLIGGVR